MIENDVVLETIISMINKVDTIEMGITLNIKGTLITGLLISKSTYLKGIASSFEGQGEVGSAFSNMFLKLDEHQKNESKEENSEVNDNVNDDNKSVFGIHLKNAKMFDGENTHTLGYWRGKLSSVDGFTFGNLERQYN
ncbi:gas vesicle accessory protein GvpU [Lysinibacillus sphaericus]|uniref:gas vesicle accessory protein GvpU n=1 Tax=Lysinibacillus sphaericus TaxID=1421 RepID=UPI00055F9BBD|nr:gas vesicle accessory protein GvpU [Lysinibacillus sphaericus]